MSASKKGSADGALWKKKVAEKKYWELAFKRQPAAKALWPTVAETAKDVILGAAAGSYVGTTVFGKYSFWAGLAATLAGHATGWNMASSFGVGMMASGGKNVMGVNGTENMEGFNKEAFKARHAAFVESWKEKLVPGIPKFSKEKSEEETVGDVKVFNYPEYKEFSGLADLDRLEAELMESARRYQGKTQPGMSGAFGEVEFSERIY